MANKASQTSTTFRHFKALSKKNWINWTRTPSGNCLELGCPVVLTLFMFAARLYIEKDYWNEFNLDKLRHTIYPASKLQDDGIEYLTNIKQMVDMGEKLEEFVVNGKGADPTVGYIPFTDVTGPLLFFPQQCTPDVKRNIYASPIIAYIKNDNPVQEQLVKQVKSHFDSFGTVIDIVMQNDIFLDSVTGELKKLKTQETIEAEAVSKVIDSQMNHWSGQDRKFSELTFPEIKFSLQEFENKTALEDYIKEPDYGFNQTKPAVCFAFQLMQNEQNKYELELMFNDQIVLDYRSIPNQMDNAADQNQLFPQVRAYAYYSYYGFAYMQNWAANTILKHVTKTPTAEIVAMTIPFKLTPLVKDPFTALLYFILPHFIMLMFIPLIYRLTYRIVREKELRTKEMMAEMGMKTFSFWMSWALYFTCVNLMMCTSSWFVLWFGCFSYTGPLVLWLVIFLYGQSIFGFIMLLQSFFSEARTAAVTTTIVYFGSALTLQLGEQAPTWKKFLVSLSPCACMQQTVKVIVGFEQNGVGITIGSLTHSYRNWNCALGFGMFIASFWIMNLLGLYFDNVVPRKYGKHYPPCYCLPGCASAKQKKKKLRQANQRKISVEGTEKNIDFAGMTRDFECRNTNPENYEGVPHNIAMLEESNMLMKVQDLWKQYDNGMKAVNGINLKMYADQIFVLLGHNGAGKSSLISCLTGLYEPSRGGAEVYGVDMITEFDKVRQFLGICPQHDVYFDLLTPREHLELFYDFKGGDPDPTKKMNEIDGLIKSIGLTDQQHDQTSLLSGGYQRKLSVCLALVGGSKLIIMDEPTSALDCNARRSIWTCLKEYKKDRIVLLTTHYMDEADILGDRIGIMTKGKITCLGSSLFLKKKFGVGYNLALIKTKPADNTIIEKFFKHKLGPECQKVTETQAEIVMQVPVDYASQFKTFFEEFDRMMLDLNIESYAISATTLEDVFLKVGHLADFDATGKTPDQHTQKEQALTTGKKTGMNDSFVGHDKTHLAHVDGLSNNDDGDKTEVAFKQDFVDFMDKANHTSIQSPSHADQEHRFTRKSSNTVTSSTQEKKYKNMSRQGVTEMPMYKIKTDKGDTGDEQQLDSGHIHSMQKGSASKINPYSSTSSHRKQPQELEYSLAYNGTESSFTSSFLAVILKRIQLWQSSKKMLYEFLLPILIMCVGVGLTSIDMYSRSTSRILDPTRVSDMKGGQTILWDNQVVLKGGDVTVEQIVANFPDQEYFKMEVKDTKVDFLTNVFQTFADFVYWYGISFRSTWPFFYCAYQVYEADTKTQQYKFYNFVNLTNGDGAGLYPQYMYEAILRTAVDDPTFEFKVRNTPMPITNEMYKRKVSGNAAAVIFLTAVSYGMLMTSIVGGIVWERMSGIKHMQMISGMNRSAYWMANFVIDLIQVEIIVLISVLAFYLANLKYTTSWIIYMLFPVASIPLTYVTSYLFQSESSAQTGTIFMNFGSILFGSTLVYYLRFIKEWEVIGDFLNDLFKLLPSYTLGASVYFDASMKDLVEFRDATLGDGRNLSADPFTWENVYGDIMSYVVHFCFWSLVLVAIELGLEKKVKELFSSSRVFPRFNPNRRFDPDVAAEARKVNDPSEPGYRNDEDVQIKVKNLRKVFQQGGRLCEPGAPLVALENCSFGLEKGECFALLGVNGAGKSTAFNILTGGLGATGGNISVQGMDIDEDFQEIRKLIGYCPQRDPIFEQLTVEQNIEYFARLKGIPSNYRRILIENAIQKLGLQDHRQKPSGTLSGGNKRKLSVAISIVGNPPIILLDEPSSGMDPEARRFMWSVISQITAKKTSAVVFSSRLMDEAEALCTKMGIMIKGGEFKCFGSAHHIKEKFGGDKYEVEFKIEVPNHEDLKSLAQEELNAFIDNGWEIDMVEALRHLKSSLSELVVGRITDELVTTYKNSIKLSTSILHLKQLIDNPDYNPEFAKAKNMRCSAVVFAEKLFTQRNMFGAIKSICQQWRPAETKETEDKEENNVPEEGQQPIIKAAKKKQDNIELLEQYGNYCRLRLSRQDKTLGQMFGMVDDLKEEYQIQQYSISQMKLEQIFQSLVSDKYDTKVKTFSLLKDTFGKETLTLE